MLLLFVSPGVHFVYITFCYLLHVTHGSSSEHDRQPLVVLVVFLVSAFFVTLLFTCVFLFARIFLHECLAM